jgi:hypothetical protein
LSAFAYEECLGATGSFNHGRMGREGEVAPRHGIVGSASLWLVGCTGGAAAPPPDAVDPPALVDTSEPSLVVGTGDTGGPLVLGPPLVEFDGVAPNGEWVRVAPVPSDFEYTVAPGRLELRDAGGANQHLVRTGFVLEPDRPYRVAVTFTLDDDHDGINAFAVQFAVDGADGDPAPISSHAVNLDLDGPAGTRGGTLRHMGFVAGDFEQVGSTRVDDVSAGRAYRIVVDVNLDATGATAPGQATVVLTEVDTSVERARFTGDWTTHPWQPAPGARVRLGFNGHAADWTATELEVRYLDR